MSMKITWKIQGKMKKTAQSLEAYGRKAQIESKVLKPHVMQLEEYSKAMGRKLLKFNKDETKTKKGSQKQKVKSSSTNEGTSKKSERGRHKLKNLSKLPRQG